MLNNLISLVSADRDSLVEYLEGERGMCCYDTEEADELRVIAAEDIPCVMSECGESVPKYAAEVCVICLEADCDTSTVADDLEEFFKEKGVDEETFDEIIQFSELHCQGSILLTYDEVS